MSKPASVLLAVTVLTGCAQLPQTRAEFQQLVRGGAALSQTDSHVANRSLDDVVRSLRSRLGDCFDYNVSWSRTEGAAVGMFREKWQSSVRTLDKDHAEVTVQRVVGGAVHKQPEGGIYVVALDLERIDAASTRLTFYGPGTSFGKSTWDSLRQWSAGKPAACPKGVV